MKTVRILSRTLVVENEKILLVRNKGAKYWYPPGGGWEYNDETITECAVREVKEETGYDVEVEKMLWLQEFHEGDKIFFETFWLAKLKGGQTENISRENHVDLDPNGMVEEIRWYNQDDLKNLTVFPKRIKSYSKLIDEQRGITDPFIGTFL